MKFQTGGEMLITLQTSKPYLEEKWVDKANKVV